MQVLVERVDQTAEIEEILEIFNTSFIPELHTRVKSLRDYAKKLNEHGELYVARQGDQIIGFISYYMNNWVTQTAYISLLAVLPEYRRNGIGEELLNGMKKRAIREGFQKAGLEVEKDNERAIAFYKKHGAVFVKEKSGRTNYMEMPIAHILLGAMRYKEPDVCRHQIPCQTS
ncbi:MAG: GNAT family N-acetyltransferase [Lachnospiraceae bacterium]|nr:GNAT family N-acetyltransferase [Lachnospiraceae bacterium]